MMTVNELAEIVALKTPLRKVGSRFVGRCPFHGPDRRPSFNVFRGRNGEARYYCFSCGASGSAITWMMKVEKKTYREAVGVGPDPEIARERKERQRRLEILHEFKDRYPDCCVPDEFLLNHPDWMIEGDDSVDMHLSPKKT